MTLEDLEKIVAARASASPDDSWTAKLLAKGPEKCAEKFGEEAVEAIIEAVRNDPEKLASEAADVLFHLLVMLRARGVTVAQVMAVLSARQTRSGLAEKAARPE
ncbi:phosphoribosyl-ATP diphosphatase [Sagittula salina]|uniref:Phosphoribosyl-ATP pyrophosphatase n=1 Tax=Sagittula salina TaxID=2820268 RepID=A0A940MNF0_9RHOB|nr:phosphoribosyl-ATP diphosphatase [Sagittula salina]MBP0481733.1 phosphoribosyl-ATP diphosphatase [Sagittula salina]